MSRRRTGLAGPWKSEDRQSIGDTHVNEACAKINLLQQKTMAVMVDYQQTREQTLSMLFHDADIDKLKLVRGMVEPSSNIATYTLYPSTTLTIDYDGALVPTIKPARLRVYQERLEPLRKVIDAARVVHEQFEEVKGVLRWFNRQATPGAIRYLWPTALKLCPTSTAFRDLQEVPSRYSQPPNVASWTQAIKDSASTIAAAAMLPADAVARKRNTMWLTFTTRLVQLPHDGVLGSPTSYHTDQIVYNL